MKLVLFDIDGTLIRDRGAARDSFADALREIYGQDPLLDRFDFSGRTDPEIVWMVLEESNLEDASIEDRLESFWKSYLRGLRERIGRNTVRLLPGVESLLVALSNRADVTLALLTGNIEPGARAKLEPFDLNRFFDFGAFGSDSRFRIELPAIALRRAREHDGNGYRMEDLVVIGDSIFDVRCATPHGARSVAVATGVTPASLLLAESPDFFFETLEETERVIDVICA